MWFIAGLTPACRSCTAKPRTRSTTLDALPNAPLRHKGILTHVQLDVHQDPHLIYCQAAFQLVSPQHVLVHGVVPSRMQDLSRLFVELTGCLSAHFSTHPGSPEWQFSSPELSDPSKTSHSFALRAKKKLVQHSHA